MNETIKTCKLCDEVLERANGTYCSKDHYRPCKQCGKEYLVKKVVKPPEFCSGSCGAKYRTQKHTVEKDCILCGDSFTTTNSNAKYCEKTHTKKCLKCGEVFTIKNPSKSKDFCSKECSIESKGKTAICKLCNEKFTVTIKNIKYCNNPHYINCKYCSKAVLVKSPKSPPTYCSTSCASRDVEIKKFCKICEEHYSNSEECPKGHKNTCVVCEKVYSVKNNSYKSKTCSQKCSAKITDYEERNRKGRETLKQKYGVTNSYQIPYVIENMINSSGNRVSKLNKKWKDGLEKACGVNFTLERKFAEGMYADLSFEDKIFIDINPTISHNSSVNFLHAIKRCVKTDCKHTPKDSDYHHKRFLAAEEAGVTLLQYFDWMNKDIFISVVKSKLHLDSHKVYARKCNVKEVTQTEANKFLKENHLLGAAKLQTYCVGLYYEGELVHLNTYGKARFNQNFEWEAIRSCSKKDWHVQGGLQRCDKQFIKEKNPESIISYVDLALGGGVSESINPGWNLRATNKPSATWVYCGLEELRGGKPLYVRDLSAQKLSADKLLGLEVGEKYPEFDEGGVKITNSDVLLAEGYLKIFDAGTRTFSWNNN